MATNELYKTLNFPGIKIFKSKVSNQYFTGLKVEDSPECIANITKFVHPDISVDEYEHIKNSDIKHSVNGTYIDFYLHGKHVRSMKIGSYIMKNMYGSLISVTEQNFADTFIELDKNNTQTKLALTHYFFITLFLEVYIPSKDRYENVITSIVLDTYHVYPPRDMIIEYCKENLQLQKMSYYKEAHVNIHITHITELTKEQYDAYLLQS